MTPTPIIPFIHIKPPNNIAIPRRQRRKRSYGRTAGDIVRGQVIALRFKLHSGNVSNRTGYIIIISMQSIWHRHARKAAAVPERTVPDARDAVGYRHTRKAAAAGERQLPNARHRPGYRHARQPAATIERIRRDARHSVRNRHARKPATAVERIRSNARHGLAAERRRDGHGTSTG